MISGTNGLMGAADGAFLLQKEKRTGSAATLEVSGRDQQDQRPSGSIGTQQREDASGIPLGKRNSIF